MKMSLTDNLRYRKHHEDELLFTLRHAKQELENYEALKKMKAVQTGCTDMSILCRIYDEIAWMEEELFKDKQKFEEGAAAK